MKVVTRPVSVFIAKDGKEFLTEKECQDYENNVLERLNKINYFVVLYNADLTETGCFMCRNYVAVEVSCSGHLSEDYLATWAFRIYGSKVAFVQGRAPCSNWSIVKSDKKAYDKAQPIKWGGYETQTEKLFFSNGAFLPGFPEPIPVAKMLEEQ